MGRGGLSIVVSRVHSRNAWPNHILSNKKNLFEFNGNTYLQTHGVALGKKRSVSFANIHMAETETNLIQRRNTIGSVSLMTFSIFGTVTEKTQPFIKETNKSHPTTSQYERTK